MSQVKLSKSRPTTHHHIISLEISPVTGKWLVILHLNGEKRVILPHYRQADAVAAVKIVSTVFGRYTPKQLRKPKFWTKALLALDYDDDDEVLAVTRSDGSLDFNPKALAVANQDLQQALQKTKSKQS